MTLRPHVLVLAFALVAAGVFLATHAPFGFYSPDGSFHAAKLLRAQEHEPFLDPFSGTPSIYPALFHWLYGGLGRALGLGTLRLYSVAGVTDFLGLFVAFLLLARAALGDWERAAFAALALPLLFYAPSGRHILLANPANLGLPLLLAGACGFVVSLRGSLAALVAGTFLASLAANVVWYLALPAAALIGTRLLVQRDWRRGRVAAGLVAAALLPCLFTAWHLWTIRESLAAYRGFGPGVALTAEIVSDWARVLFDKGNRRFAAVTARDALPWAHYFLGVLPFSLVVLAATARRLLDSLRGRGSATERLLVLAGWATLALSLALAATGDFPRVVSVQFAGWCLLALVALDSLAKWQGLAAAAGRIALASLGVVGLAATVVHTDRGFGELAPQRPTRAVVELISALPDHARERIFVSEEHLRELAPFVTFTSFVNHLEGRYHSQDPASSAVLLAAYRQIRDHGPGWRAAVEESRVRYLAFRHTDVQDRELGLFYLAQGRAALQNDEWWVVEIGR